MEKFKKKLLIERILSVRKRNSNIFFYIGIFLLPIIFYAAYYIGKLTIAEKHFIEDQILPKVFIVIGISQLILAFYKFFIQWKVKHWEKINCTILDIQILNDYKIVANPFSSVKYICPVIIYEYEFNKQKFFSHKLINGVGWTFFKKGINKRIQRFHIGGTFLCYVNPQKPSIAALDNKIFWGDIIFYLLISVFFFSVAIVIQIV